MMNAVDLKAMESRLTANFENHFSQVLKAVEAKIEPKKCEFCGDTTHATDECESLQQDVKYLRNQHPQYAYETWRKNSNLRWRNEETEQQQHRQGLYIHPNTQTHTPPKPQPPLQNTQPSSSNPQPSSSNFDMAQLMAMMQNLSGQMAGISQGQNNLTQNQAAQGLQMQNMEMQIKQIVGEVNVSKAQRDNKLPSQGKGPDVKPVLAINLRSGKEVKSPEEKEEIIMKKKSDEKDKGK